MAADLGAHLLGLWKDNQVLTVKVASQAVEINTLSSSNQALSRKIDSQAVEMKTLSSSNQALSRKVDSQAVEINTLSSSNQALSTISFVWSFSFKEGFQPVESENLNFGGLCWGLCAQKSPKGKVGVYLWSKKADGPLVQRTVSYRISCNGVQGGPVEDQFRSDGTALGVDNVWKSVGKGWPDFGDARLGVTYRVECAIELKGPSVFSN